MTSVLAQVFLVFYLVERIKSDWVEITQVETKNTKVDTLTDPPTTTTPRNYEVFLKTPAYKDVLQLTTPALYNVDAMDTTIEKSINFATTTAINKFTTNFASNNNKTTKNSRLRNTKSKEKITTTTHQSVYNEEYDQYKDEDLIEEPEEETGNYGGFMSFLKSVQKRLLKPRDKSVYGKISVLTQLRDNLLYNIEKRISALWQTPSPTEARGHKDDDDYHLEFPSNEGALMTIGFLTFAVFLIKLVLKLIYALKNKQQYYGTTPIPTTGAAAYIGRKKRDVDEDAARILQLIDEYKFN